MARVGLEPTRLAAQASKTCVAASYTTGPTSAVYRTTVVPSQCRGVARRRAIVDRSTSLRPRAERAAEHDQLAQVIGVVVGDQERLAENRLPIPVRDAGEQVRPGVGDQGLHGRKVGSEPGDTPVP